MDKSNNSTSQITDLTVPYALAVTLDLPDNQDINIYDEIKERIEIMERERLEIEV